VMKCPAFVWIETAFVEKDTIFDCASGWKIRHNQPRRFSRDFGDIVPVDLVCDEGSIDSRYRILLNGVESSIRFASISARDVALKRATRSNRASDTGIDGRFGIVGPLGFLVGMSLLAKKG
jgi:hypothetical protein